MTRLVHVGVLSTLFLLVGCSIQPQVRFPPESEAVWVELPNGTRTQVWTVPDKDDEEEEDEEGQERRSLLGGSGDGHTYMGSARKAAKLGISTANITSFQDVCSFLNALPSDSNMRTLKISKSSTSGRVSQEEFNARFIAYVLASSYPKDNDFHVILGNDPNNPKCLLNVEVSGLPDPQSATYATLDAARKSYITCLGAALPTGGYKIYKPGVPMELVGSGYFDVSHGAGSIGPAGFKPATAWELHPIIALRC